jgi:hypothetical protein
LEDQGIVERDNNQTKIEQLRVVKERNNAILIELKIQLTAIQAAIQNEELRAEAVLKVAQAQENLNKLKADESKAAATGEVSVTAKAITGGKDLTAMAKVLEGKISSLEAAGKDIDVAIGKLESSGKKGGRVRKKLADDEKKQRQKELKEREAAAKLERDLAKKRLDFELKRIKKDEELKTKEFKEKLAETARLRKLAFEREDAEKEFLRSLAELRAQIRAQIDEGVAGGLERIDAILDKSKGTVDLLRKNLDAIQKQSRQGIETMKETRERLQNELDLAKENLDVVKSRAPGGLGFAERELRSANEAVAETEKKLRDLNIALDKATNAEKDKTSATKAGSVGGRATTTEELEKIISDLGSRARRGTASDLLVEILGERTFSDYDQAIADARDALKILEGSTQTSSGNVDAINVMIGQTERTLAALKTDASIAQTSFESLSGENQDYRKALQEAKQAVRDAERKLEGVEAEAEAGLSPQQVEFIAALEAQGVGLDEVGKKLLEITDKIQAARDATDPEEARKIFAQIEKELEDTGKEGETLLNLAEDIVTSFSTLISGEVFKTLLSDSEKLSDEQREILASSIKIGEAFQDISDNLKESQQELDPDGAEGTFGSALTKSKEIMVEMGKAANAVDQIIQQTEQSIREAEQAERSFEFAALDALGAQLEILIAQEALLKQKREIVGLTEEEEKELKDIEQTIKDLEGAEGDRQRAEGRGRDEEKALAAAEARVQNIQEIASTIAGGIEDLASIIDTVDSFSTILREEGPAGVVEAVGDIVAKVGKALLNAPPPINLAGAILLAAGMLAKAVAKIIKLIAGRRKTELEVAEEQALQEEKLRGLVEKRLELSEKLAEIGNIQNDQARERLALERELHAILRLNSDLANEMAGLSPEELERSITSLNAELTNAELLLAEAELLLETGSAREQREFLEGLGIDVRGLAKDELEEFIAAIKADIVKLNTEIEAGNDELDYRAILLDLEKQIIEEEIGLIQFRNRLEGESLANLEEIADLRRTALEDALKGFDVSVLEQAFGEAGAGVFDIVKGNFDAAFDSLDTDQLKEVLDSLARPTQGSARFFGRPGRAFAGYGRVSRALA